MKNAPPARVPDDVDRKTSWFVRDQFQQDGRFPVELRGGEVAFGPQGLRLEKFESTGLHHRLEQDEKEYLRPKYYGGNG